MNIKEPVHPGCIVRKVIEHFHVSVPDAAKALHVSHQELSDLINGDAGVSPEMAVRLAKAIGCTPTIWLRLQATYDLAPVERRADLIEVTPITSSITWNPAAGRSWEAQEHEPGMESNQLGVRMPRVWREGSNSFHKTVRK